MIKSEDFPPEVQGLELKVLIDTKVEHTASQALLRTDEHGREVQFPKGVTCRTMLHINTNHTRRNFIYSALTGDPEPSIAAQLCLDSPKKPSYDISDSLVSKLKFSLPASFVPHSNLWLTGQG